jgi:predicted dehydrogenase
MNTKVAIVGSGFGMYCLLPVFSRIKECDVVSISGKNSQRMTDFCKKFNVKKYDNWKDMLKKEKPNAVAIAIIPKNQFEVAKYALENGIAVFAEKPLTTTLETSIILTDLAKKQKLPNMIDFLFTEIPEWVETKKIIESGLLGEILSIDVDWKFLSYDLKNNLKSWKTDVKQGGGSLSLVFSHTLYYLEYFLGTIKNIECKIFSSEKSLNNGDTEIDMTFTFNKEYSGHAHLDISKSNSNHTIKFRGEKGNIILQNSSESFVDNFELILQINGESQKIKPKKSLNTLDPDDDSRIKVIEPLATKFITWCNSGVPSKPNFQNGSRVQELIEISRIN